MFRCSVPPAVVLASWLRVAKRRELRVRRWRGRVRGWGEWLQRIVRWGSVGVGEGGGLDLGFSCSGSCLDLEVVESGRTVTYLMLGLLLRSCFPSIL